METSNNTYWQDGVKKHIKPQMLVMMITVKKILLVCLCLWLVQPVFAQNTIENVTQRLSKEGDKLYIEYDLHRRDNSVKACKVELQINLDGQPILDPKGLSGHIGEVNPGLGKRIVWDLDVDLGKIDGELQIELKVTEITDPCVHINTTPVYLNMSIGIIGGAGLMALGWTQYKKHEIPWKYFQDNRYPNDTRVYSPKIAPDPQYDFDRSTRDTVYAQANKYYKNGQIMMISGGILIANGIIAVVQLFRIKRHNKICESVGNPSSKNTSLRWEPTLINGNPSNPGVLLAFRF